MNIVNAHTLTKARLLSLQPKGRCVRTGDSVNELFFMGIAIMRFCPKCNTETERYTDGKCKTCKAAYRADNRAKANASSAAWKAANKERRKATMAAWHKANPEYTRIRNQNRRARKLESGGKLSKGLSVRLFKLQRGKCACCGQPLGTEYNLDHIMPIALGGSNTDDNIQLLRATCNKQKHAKHPIDFMQQKGYLL